MESNKSKGAPVGVLVGVVAAAALGGYLLLNRNKKPAAPAPSQAAPKATPAAPKATPAAPKAPAPAPAHQGDQGGGGGAGMPGLSDIADLASSVTQGGNPAQSISSALSDLTSSGGGSGNGGGFSDLANSFTSGVGGVHPPHGRVYPSPAVQSLVAPVG